MVTRGGGRPVLRLAKSSDVKHSTENVKSVTPPTPHSRYINIKHKESWWRQLVNFYMNNG